MSDNLRAALALLPELKTLYSRASDTRQSPICKLTMTEVWTLIAALEELSTMAVVPRDFLKSIAETHLRDSNGGRENFAPHGHDVAVIVHKARAMIEATKTRRGE